MRQHRSAGAATLGLLLTAATLFLVGKVGSVVSPGRQAEACKVAALAATPRRSRTAFSKLRQCGRIARLLTPVLCAG